MWISILVVLQDDWLTKFFFNGYICLSAWNTKWYVEWGTLLLASRLHDTISSDSYLSSSRCSLIRSKMSRKLQTQSGKWKSLQTTPGQILISWMICWWVCEHSQICECVVPFLCIIWSLRILCALANPSQKLSDARFTEYTPSAQTLRKSFQMRGLQNTH